MGKAKVPEYEVVKDQFLHKRELFTERLIKNTRVVGDCIEWVGTVKTNGYCVINFRFFGVHVQLHVHRMFAILMTGKPIPDDFHVDHTCGNRRCVRHLEVVPYDENLRRRDRRMRARHE
jgi:hypothetical protein